jgi:hypothetical protein
MVQVLPAIPSFGEKLANVLAGAGTDIGKGFAERQVQSTLNQILSSTGAAQGGAGASGNGQTPISTMQLAKLSGHPDKRISEPAKLMYQRNADIEKQTIKADIERSSKILQEADVERKAGTQKRFAAQSIRRALNSGEISTKDYISELTGFKPLQSQSGAELKTATKEYLLGNIKRVGNKPNQWIEQQIASMAPEIGKTKEANLAVVSALEAESDIDEKRVEILDRLEQEFKATKGHVPGNIGAIAEKELQKYAIERQDILAYDLRKIHEDAHPKDLSKIETVPQGTPLTVEKARVLLDKVGGDEAKAQKLAEKLGYTIPSSSIYARQ